MAQAYDTNQVLVRRGCGLLLNPYSPKNTSNDGIIKNSDTPWDNTKPSYQEVAKWGESTQYNKEQFISDATGSIYENAEPNYIHRIKIGHSYGYGERYPYVFFRLKNRSIVKTSAGTYNSSFGYELQGRFINYAFQNNHNLFFGANNTYNLKLVGKADFVGDYNPSAPESSPFYDSITISAVNSNPDWYNFKPVPNSSTVQCWSAIPPSTQYPSGASWWWNAYTNVYYEPAHGYLGLEGGFKDISNDSTELQVGNYDSSNPGYLKYKNAPSGMTQITSNTLYYKNGSPTIQYPVWYKIEGTEWTSSNTPYDITFSLPYGGFPDIMLRYENDGQSEYDISANDIITTLSKFTKQENVSTSTDYNGAYTAFRTPENDTPYLMRNQIMKFDLRSDLINGCPDACWLKNKVVKIKLKYQLGEISIYKDAGYLPQSGNMTIQIKINYNWTTYEEETVDNIDIKFDQQDSNPYGILWSKEIECQPGQAKRLIDICVLEVRDKT